MSAYEEDAGAVGDELADLVEAGLLTDADVFAYFAGDSRARGRVMHAAIEYAGRQPDVVEDCDVYGSLQ